MKKKTGKTPRRNYESLDRSDFSAFSFDQPARRESDPYLRVRQGGQEYSKSRTKNEVRRRQNKKRKMKNKARSLFIAFVGIIGFLAIGITLSLTIFFKITDIKVTGNGVYSSEEIAMLSTIELGENLFLIDTKDCVSNLTESLPYIYDVKITRKLPSTISLEITDATPYLAIEKPEGTYILIDDRLKVLEASAEEKPAGVIMITDTQISTANPGYMLGFEDEEVAECIASLVEAVKTAEMSEATSISCVDKNNNFIVYDGRITFKLGSCNNLDSKINRGLAVCDELNDHNDSIRGTVNLSLDKQSYFTEE